MLRFRAHRWVTSEPIDCGNAFCNGGVMLLKRLVTLNLCENIRSQRLWLLFSVQVRPDVWIHWWLQGGGTYTVIPFEDQSHMDTYLSKTSGQLMWTASELLGASADFEGEVRAVAYGLGCASFLCAVPALVASGRTPLLDLTNDGLVTLARCAKSKIKRVKLQKQGASGTMACY